MTTNDARELIIIGGGPAGYTAALYAARANLSPLVIEGIQWGGQLMITSDVENYPGYPEGVLGPGDDAASSAPQAERFGAEFLTDDVTRVDFSERPFRVSVGDEEHRAWTVIVATGANARQLGLETEVALQGRGVSYCAVCDAAFFRDKTVVVVGGGDSAMEEATFLAKFASKVTIVHRREEFRASPIMVDRARQNEKIDWELNAPSSACSARRPARSPASCCATSTPARRARSPADGLFVAVGHDPNDEAVPRLARPRRRRLPGDDAGLDEDEHRGRVRGRRRAGSRLPAGGDRRRLGLYGRPGRRAVPRRRAPSRADGGVYAASAAPSRRAASDPATMDTMPYFICPNCKARSIDHDRRESLTDPTAVGCHRCGFGFLFELMDDYYPAPGTGMVVCDADGRILAAGRGCSS